jgi:hypothetical protein
VEKAKAVYEKDYQNKVPKLVMATHMGYKGLNGTSLPALSALAKYGLLEGRGDESRITDLAVQIIAHGSGTPERARALYQAAATPELFAELDSKFQAGKASDAAIRSYLLTQRFIPSAADTAVRTYRETKQFVESELGGYNPPGTAEQKPMETGHLSDEANRLLNKRVDEIMPPIQEVFHLPEGTVTVTFPKRLSSESYQDLEDQLSLILRRVKRQVDKKDEAAN